MDEDDEEKAAAAAEAAMFPEGETEMKEDEVKAMTEEEISRSASMTPEDMLAAIVREKNRLLIECCAVGEMETIVHMLEKDPDVNVNYLSFESNRARQAYVIDVKQLHPDMITIRYRPNDGWTPFLKAVFEQEEEVFEYLLRHPRLDVTVANAWGETPLHMAALSNKRLLFLEKLLDLGKIDVNAQRNDGKTALMVAACLNATECVEELLRVHGIDVNLIDRDGRTAFHLACFFGSVEVAKKLQEDPRVHVTTMDNDRDTPLMTACRKVPHQNVLLLLKDPRVDVEETNQLERNLLYIAVDHGRDKVVTALLQDPRIDVNKADNTQMTPLHLATKRLTSPLETYQAEYKNCLKLLLRSRRVDVNLKNKDGVTPLFWAVRENHPKTVKLLVAFERVDINITDNRGRTPFWVAATESSFNIISTLIKTGLPMDTKLMPPGHTSVLREMDARDRSSRIYDLVEAFLKDPKKARDEVLVKSRLKPFIFLSFTFSSLVSNIAAKKEMSEEQAAFKALPKYKQKIMRKREKEEEARRESTP